MAFNLRWPFVESGHGSVILMRDYATARVEICSFFISQKIGNLNMKTSIVLTLVLFQRFPPFACHSSFVFAIHSETIVQNSDTLCVIQQMRALRPKKMEK